MVQGSKVKSYFFLYLFINCESIRLIVVTIYIELII